MLPGVSVQKAGVPGVTLGQWLPLGVLGTSCALTFSSTVRPLSDPGAKETGPPLHSTELGAQALALTWLGGAEGSSGMGLTWGSTDLTVRMLTSQVRRLKPQVWRLEGLTSVPPPTSRLMPLF